ncbi:MULTISPECIES: sulfotransferase [unclassified Novosphingobium]|uniref:tetratricopeptide repeat-containing sulfotransferase family protein n=1 Tax=unclassified Novosphingobium TaxID=2644732 RepID=UPI00146D3047|nr:MULTISPECIES: sulfotransferase [unclassified Novosphingobium]NMN05411.1 tetratricopeptide (TPR) repeat protein [Novosphingobium sp. SG919]NMN87706.1 tetratricopeptide (TPR) repeat protein [Novosphingobium sp. SG916]
MTLTDPGIAAARQALARGDLPATARTAQAVLAVAPDHAEAQFLLGLALAGVGQVRDGIAQIVSAVARDPQGEYRAQLARLLIMTREDSAAAQVLADAEGALPDDALSRDTMGCVYARLGDHAASLPHFAHAVAGEPDNLEYRYNYAAALNFVGAVDAAEAALEALLALAPGHARAHHLLASLKRHSAGANHVPRLRARLTAAQDPQDRLLLGYALAKELDDLGEDQAAFAALAAANAEHRARLPYRFETDAANFDAIVATWPALARARVSAPPAEAPIFVIGMPRTGTTLVDRIASSHAQVESAGELQAMPLAVKHAAGTRTRTVLDPETIAALAQADLGTVGHDYLARAHHHRRNPNLRFVDKFPGNFHYAGIVARCFPNARIICLRRHPMDTVLSNFRNLFAITSRYYDYSYDLMDIARYYVRFDRLMAFWHQALPGRILDVQYEDLVADQEGVTRRMLEHCGLEWDAACLDFHRNAAPVSTPSAAQVRRPLYRDALARWKRHEAALAPVAAYFAGEGITIT